MFGTAKTSVPPVMGAAGTAWVSGLRGKVGVFQARPGLGDLIWHLPHIRAIAAATRGQVTLITKPSTQAEVLLAGDPAIESIVWFDRQPRLGKGRHDGPLGFLAFVAALRAARLQSCVLLHHSASLAAAMALAGIRYRYGYGYAASQRLWLNRPPFMADDSIIEAFEQATAYTDAAGLSGLPEPALARAFLPQPALQQFLASLPRPIAVFGVGAHGRNRQWGPENYARLAEALIERRSARTVLLMAAQHEATLVQAILDGVSAACAVRAAVGWPLQDVAALLATADLFIGNDSGLMNLRAASGRPAYALFGASGPLRHSKYIRAIIPDGGARAGMDKITVAQVVETVT